MARDSLSAHEDIHSQGRQMTTTLSGGDKAPAFTLPTDGDGEFSLADAKGQALVLYFYPRDDTPGCTKEAIGFTEQAAAFKKAGAMIVGVSKDTVAKHDKFKAKHDLNVVLASDAGRRRLRTLRRLGREKDVWKDVYGHRARDLPDRRDGRRS